PLPLLSQRRSQLRSFGPGFAHEGLVFGQGFLGPLLHRLRLELRPLDAAIALVEDFQHRPEKGESQEKVERQENTDEDEEGRVDVDEGAREDRLTQDEGVARQHRTSAASRGASSTPRRRRRGLAWRLLGCQLGAAHRQGAKDAKNPLALARLASWRLIVFF